MNLLCGPPSNLCVSAFNGHFNAEAAKIRRAPQRKRIKFATFCAKHLLVLDDGRYYLRHQSVTKPVTAIGIMFLMEEGKLALNEPVENTFPRSSLLLTRGIGSLFFICSHTPPRCH